MDLEERRVLKTCFPSVFQASVKCWSTGLRDIGPLFWKAPFHSHHLRTSSCSIQGLSWSVRHPQPRLWHMMRSFLCSQLHLQYNERFSLSCLGVLRTSWGTTGKQAPRGIIQIWLCLWCNKIPGCWTFFGNTSSLLWKSELGLSFSVRNYW